MSIANSVSPSRQYRVIMMTADEERVVKFITLPTTLVNDSATVEIWYQKYVPEGHLLIDVEPVEVVEDVPTAKPESEHVGYGRNLDFIGEEPIEEDDESEEDDHGGEAFVSFEPVIPPKDEA